MACYSRNATELRRMTCNHHLVAEKGREFVGKQ
jgi:hypothetical protein